MPTGLELIVAERERQIEELGYDAIHDGEHEGEELAFAAACYAAPTTIYLISVDSGQITDPQSGRPSISRGAARWVEPWPLGWRREERPETLDVEQRLEEIAKAGALLAAEADRLMSLYDLTDDDLGVE